MMTLDQFNETMLRGEYRTPEENRPPRPLKRGLRAWWRFFAMGLFRVAWRGSAVSRRGAFTQRTFSELSYDLVRAVESTGATVEVSGAAALAGRGGAPCVYVANHMGLVETLHLPCITGAFGPVTVIAKRSLARYPVFGDCIRAVRPVLLGRENARKDLAETLALGKERLRDGISVIVFPQGSRRPVFTPRGFNSLGTKLAREAGVPLVPIACKTDFALPGRLLKDLGPVDPARPVRFAIGPVLSPVLSQAEMQQASISFIQSTLTQWGCPCESDGPAKR